MDVSTLDVGVFGFTVLHTFFQAADVDLMFRNVSYQFGYRPGRVNRCLSSRRPRCQMRPPSEGVLPKIDGAANGLYCIARRLLSVSETDGKL
jgi:hypothetical protein